MSGERPRPPRRPRSPFRFDRPPRPRSASPEPTLTNIILVTNSDTPRPTPPPGEFDITNPSHVNLRRKKTALDPTFDALWRRDAALKARSGFITTSPAIPTPFAEASSDSVFYNNIEEEQHDEYEEEEEDEEDEGEEGPTVSAEEEDQRGRKRTREEDTTAEEAYRYPTAAEIRGGLTRESGGTLLSPKTFKPRDEKFKPDEFELQDPEAEGGEGSTIISKIPEYLATASHQYRFLRDFIGRVDNVPDAPPARSMNSLGYTLHTVDSSIEEVFKAAGVEILLLPHKGSKNGLVLRNDTGGFMVGFTRHGWYRVPFSEGAKRKHLGSNERGVEALGLNAEAVAGRIRLLGEYWEIWRVRGENRLEEMEREEVERKQVERQRAERRERITKALRTRGAEFEYFSPSPPALQAIPEQPEPDTSVRRLDPGSTIMAQASLSTPDARATTELATALEQMNVSSNSETALPTSDIGNSSYQTSDQRMRN
ncbi:hypothetical protein H072_531 [Dactylellina haptotyla CBS 200.50]|uniref:Uncharacterized protein n=1 Tax=Dactylellina haptotyla (strain CBS 200.50) TaxID=1284197 RepID=S8C161_DACHA|nr:hypothetical protein H072_531 [Dactylellina haptotyla CBS 200.50]